MEEGGPEDSLGLPEIRIMKRVERKGHRTKSEESQLGLCFVFITHCIPMGAASVVALLSLGRRFFKGPGAEPMMN